MKITLLFHNGACRVVRYTKDCGAVGVATITLFQGEGLIESSGLQHREAEQLLESLGLRTDELEKKPLFFTFKDEVTNSAALDSPSEYTAVDIRGYHNSPAGLLDSKMCGSGKGEPDLWSVYVHEELDGRPERWIAGNFDNYEAAQALCGVMLASTKPAAGEHHANH